MAQTVTLQLPDETLQRYRRGATAARKALDEFLTERLMEAVPPLAGGLPSPLREEVKALENLDDEALWRVAQSQLPPARQRLYTRLLAKNSAGDHHGRRERNAARSRRRGPPSDAEKGSRLHAVGMAWAPHSLARRVEKIRMTRTRISRSLRQRVVAEFRNQCAYCHTLTSITGARLVIDHIVPEAAGGQTVWENLCLACHSCNEFKGAQVEARDPLTGKSVLLFHPRIQQWSEHFYWSEACTECTEVMAAKSSA